MISVNNGDLTDAEKIANEVNKSLISLSIKIPGYTPNVEQIQDLVEQKLMQSEFLDVAKAYILYRNTQNQKRKRNVFEKRITLKPYEYPLYKFISKSKGDLTNGKLYVASMEEKKWIEVSYEKHKELRKKFKNHVNIFILFKIANLIT